MGKPLDFRLKLTLEEMALRKVVVNLWNETDILSSFEQLQIGSVPRNQRLKYILVIIDKIKAKISELELPESLKKRMIEIVKPMSSSLLNWEIMHNNILNWSKGRLCMPVLKQLCWTSTGTIDHRRTAETLLHLDILEDFIRYKFACQHCLVAYIPSLFEELREGFKNYYVSKSPFSENKIDMDCYWAFILKGKGFELDRDAAIFLPRGVSFDQHAFALSAIYGNKGAAEYFFNKLPKEERNTFLSQLIDTIILNRSGGPQNLMRYSYTIPTDSISEIVLYMLSLMNLEQQMEVLKSKPCDLFICFLDWPWQDVALEIANLIWPFLPESEYCYLLKRMTQNIEILGYYLPNFFQNFFLDSPSKFKNHFINHECHHFSFFPKFLDAEDTVTIKTIFHKIDVKDRMKLVSCFNFFLLLDPLIMTDKKHLVKICLEGAISSKEDKSSLKSTYTKFFTRIDGHSSKLRKRKWKKFFRDIGKTIASTSSKRNPNDKSLTKAKKHRRRKCSS